MLDVNNLFCERDDRVLFQALDFTLSGGQAIQVQGANGSGKTTLLRILCGLNSDFEGTMTWEGQPMNKARTGFLADTFYLGHMPAINKALSPVENLRWFCASRGQPATTGITEALASMGLRGYDDLPCYMLSAGQQRRVSLARLKLTTARLWILDEPFTALDHKGVSHLENLLGEFVMAGGALILTTHHALQLDCPVQVVDLDAAAGQGVVA